MHLFYLMISASPVKGTHVLKGHFLLYWNQIVQPDFAGFPKCPIGPLEIIETFLKNCKTQIQEIKQ